MKRSMRKLLLVLPVLAVAVPFPRTGAQSVSCGADDGQCLSNSLRLACEETKATAESCLGWLGRDIEASPFASNPEWKLAAGRGYLLAAELLRSADDAERFRERSRSIFQDVIAGWPDSEYARRAYRGLSTVARDVHERIYFLRNVLRLEPTRANNMAFLADALTARGESGDTREAAELYRRAYGASGDPKVWGFASDALKLFTSVGLADEAAALKAQVARDSGMAGFDAEVAAGRFAQNLGRAAEVIGIACNRFIVDIFGRGTCANALSSLADATRRSAAPSSERQSLVDVTVEGMRMLRIEDDARYSETGDERRIRYAQLRAVLQEWIDTDIATASAYVLFAQLPSALDPSADDLDESVSAYQRAVELAPDNTQYRYWLALGYIEQDRFDEALEHLRIVRDSLTENLGPDPELVDAQIRKAETAMRRESVRTGRSG